MAGPCKEAWLLEVHFFFHADLVDVVHNDSGFRDLICCRYVCCFIYYKFFISTFGIDSDSELILNFELSIGLIVFVTLVICY